MILLASALAAAQVTQTYIVKSTTPDQDSKPNSGEVPDGLAIESEFERVVVLRFKYKADLLEAFERMVAQHDIRNAVILAGIGSVRNYHIHAVSNRVFPSENIFTRDPTKPADIVGMNGYVIDGRIHAHMTLADGDKAFGGHLERGTNVFTFAIVTLGVFKDGIDLSRVDDKTYR
ncbi:MAG: DNA-binding protein [Bryobacterales bacterium]|nr:DNA-binding protein [Bryobacterales bacterium]